MQIAMHADRPLISVITVTLNSGNDLVKSRQSVTEQSLENIEHVVVDGGSLDETTNFLSCDPDARLRWVSEADDGIYDAMNKGVRLARGKLIMFLNAGDVLYHKDVLAKFMDLYYSDDGYALYLCKVKKNSGKIINPILPSLKRRWKMPTYHQGIIYTRKALIALPFDTRFRLAADYNNFVRLSFSQPYRTVREILVQYDTQGVSSRLRAELEREYLTIYREAGFGISSVLLWHASEIYRKLIRYDERRVQRLKSSVKMDLM
jgi:putative colanic acid biosynthesis glycosyltransferase